MMPRLALFLHCARPTARPSRLPSTTAATLLSSYPRRPPGRVPARSLSWLPRPNNQQVPPPPPEYDYDPSLDHRFLPRLGREITLSLRHAIWRRLLRAPAPQPPDEPPRPALTRQTLAVVAALLAAAAAVVCWQNFEVVPVTGRWRVAFASLGDAVNKYHDKLMPAERIDLYVEKDGGHLVPDSDPRNARVKRVLATLLPVSGLSGCTCVAHVTEGGSGNISMFIIPGSALKHIFVPDRFLHLMADDDQLAGTLAHELAHASQRHIDEIVTWTTSAVALLTGIPLLSRRRMTPLAMPVKILGTYLVGGLVGYILYCGLSRGAEREADILGLLTMVEAGYDPRVMPAFWKKIEKLESKHVSRPEFLRRHPPARERAQLMEYWAHRAMETRTPGSIYREKEDQPEVPEQTLIALPAPVDGAEVLPLERDDDDDNSQDASTS